MTNTLKLEIDDERTAVLAGCCILEAADSPRAWRLFWLAVRVARHEFHQTRSHPGRRRMTAATTGDEQGASAPRARPTGRSRPARVVPSELSLIAEPPAEAGTGSDSPSPKPLIPGEQ
jgi:hypothetical protein